MPQLVSLSATTTEAPVPRACALQLEKPLQWEAQANEESSPTLPQTESPGVAMEGAERKDGPVAKNNYKNYFKTKLIYKLVIWVVKEISRVTVTY